MKAFSHRSKRAMRIALVCLVLALASFVLKPGSHVHTDPNDPSVASTTLVDGVQVYAQASATPSVNSNDTDNTTDDANSPANEKNTLITQTKTIANQFVAAWTTYDYNKPPAYSSLTGASQDDANNRTLKDKYNQHLQDMKNNKELSSGNITNTQIAGLKYSGDVTTGTGDGKVRVSVAQTISNSKVGSAGSIVNHVFEVSVKKLDTTSSADQNNWFVYDINQIS